MESGPPSAGVPVRLGSTHPLLFAVDDEPNNLELIERALRGSYRIRTFDDPLRALSAAKAEPPDVVLTDYRMPHLNGLALLRSLKSVGVTAVALLVTAFGDTEDVLKASRDEQLFVRILPKPWKASELRAQVDLAVGLYNLRITKRPSTPPRS